uniref:PAS domain-containing serine/threonine-protein kinase n=1 Tax=Magallana gigas TaxID=29159 RepID=A0A8W8N2U6_MAGGI|nr:PAS domain-containing serine/threonine-protein kinase isoform X1 [Crassostrea gigas]
MDKFSDYSPLPGAIYNRPYLSSTPDVLQPKRYRDLNINNGLNGLGRENLFGDRMTFGSPSYPSPLDRIRADRSDLRYAAEINGMRESSFEINQSFPKMTKTSRCLDETMTKPRSKKVNLQEEIRDLGCEFHDVSFGPGQTKGSWSSELHPDRENWSFYSYIGGGHTGTVFPSTIRNPNKAICTINSKTSEILTANDMTCELFGYETEELLGKKLKDLIKLKPKEQATIQECHFDESSGNIVSLAGKVVDAIDSNGLIMPISVWVKKLEQEAEQRALVVMEPVERTVAMVTFNAEGTILSCDHQMAYLYGYFSPDDLEGVKIKQLIPSLQLPVEGKPLEKDLRKQRATGKTKDGACFPLSLSVKLASEVDSSRPNSTGGVQDDRKSVYVGILWVFSNISGLVTMLPDGTINSINENFALMLFGYSRADLIGKDISILIPDFYDILELEENSEAASHHSGLDNPNLLPDDNKDLQEVDSSDDQGIGSSITSNQCPPAVDTHPLLGPGVTSTPNRAQAVSFFRRGSNKESGSEVEISPLAGGMKQDQIGRLEFSDSEEEEEAMIRTDARSPETCQSDMSASSTETVPTAREVTRNVAIIQEVNKGCFESCDGNGLEEKNCEKGLSTNECHSKKTEDEGKDKGDSVSEQMLVVCNSQEEKNSPVACTAAQTPVIDEDVKTQSKSETESSQLSADRAVFLQTLHDTNKILMEIKSSMDDPVVCVDPKAEADFRQENVEQRTANVNSQASVDSVGKNQKSELNVSNSTVELLAAGVGVLDLSDSGCLEREMDSLDKSGTLADISSSVHSSAILKDCSRESLRDDSSFPAHQDYIPKCNTDSVLEEISSVENSLDLVHGVEVNKSPLLHINSNNSCHSSGHSTDHQPESSFDPVSSYNHSSSLLTDSVSFHERDSGCSPRKHKRRDRGKEASNQHSSSSASQSVVFPEGSYAGQGKHRDRSYLGIIFQLKRVTLEDGSVRYCMWVSRDPEEPAEGGRSFANLTLATTLNSTMDCSGNFSLGDLLADKACSDSKVEHDGNVKEGAQQNDGVEDDGDDGVSAGRGLFDIKYHTLNAIGKGAFGFVKLARRKIDEEEVVVKFIKKNKVLSECWTEDQRGRRLPLEVSLLKMLKHPNIVKVLDVFENEDYIQMVMEKHGSGMDLFEFIDRSPLMDEALASYIFRQIVAGVAYLHSLNIVHRDIKDENVILNEDFRIKLIDFGAAAYMMPGKLFGTFCGTMEYCSPEVLLGNRYEGPELEMWSLGVTLYTLVYGENPFFDVEETIKGKLKPPFQVSRGLTHLLSGLLNPSPAKRLTVKDCQRDIWTNQPVDASQYSWEEVLPNCEFHGNTASDNRIDSPDSKVNSQNAASHTEKYIDKVYTDKELLPPVPPFSPPGYHTHVFDSKYYSVVDV